MSPVLEEVGRIIYSNNAVTINLAWALAAILGLGLCEYRIDATDGAQLGPLSPPDDSLSH